MYTFSILHDYDSLTYISNDSACQLSAGVHTLPPLQDADDALSYYIPDAFLFFRLGQGVDGGILHVGKEGYVAFISTPAMSDVTIVVSSAEGSWSGGCIYNEVRTVSARSS